MDLLRAGEMLEESRSLASTAVRVAAYRYVFDGRRRSVVICDGPEVWETFCRRDDALTLAIVLVELWWGNDSGARRMLVGQWDTDDDGAPCIIGGDWHDDLVAATEAGWMHPRAPACDSEGGEQ
jgi:hypothetical protein